MWVISRVGSLVMSQWNVSLISHNLLWPFNWDNDGNSLKSSLDSDLADLNLCTQADIRQKCQVHVAKRLLFTEEPEISVVLYSFIVYLFTVKVLQSYHARLSEIFKDTLYVMALLMLVMRCLTPLKWTLCLPSYWQKAILEVSMWGEICQLFSTTLHQRSTKKKKKDQGCRLWGLWHGLGSSHLANHLLLILRLCEKQYNTWTDLLPWWIFTWSVIVLCQCCDKKLW